MKQWIVSNIKSLLPSEKSKLQNALFITATALFFLYCFSIPAFSNIYPFNYISIAISGLMCLTMGIYVFLYSNFRINIFVLLLILFNLSMIATHIVLLDFSSFPKTIALMSVIAFFSYHFISAQKNKNLYILLILIAGLFFAVVYFAYYGKRVFDLSSLSDGRLGSEFDNQNELAKEFGIFASISFACVFKYKNKIVKALSAVSLLLFVFLIITTGSISNLFTTFIICSVLGVIFQKTVKRKIICGVAIACAIGLFVAVLQIPAFEYFKRRIGNIISTLFNSGKDGYDGSSFERFEAAILAFKVGLNRILFGFGFMSANEYTVTSMQAHNNFAELFLDYGSVGLLIFEALYFIPLYKGFSDKNRHFILSVMAYMFVFQLFLTTYYKKFEYIILGFAFASLDEYFKTKFVLFNSSILHKDKSKKRILEIIPSLDALGGAESFVTDFIMSVQNRYKDLTNIKLVILFKQKKNHLLDKLRESGVDVIELSKKKGIDFTCACSLRDVIYDYNPNIIHTHLLSLTTLKLALPFGRPDIKIYHTIHNNFSKGSTTNILIKCLTKFKYLRPICVAKTPADKFSKYIGKDINFINNGIDISRYKNSLPPSKRDIDFLFVGRLVEIKNFEYMLRLINLDVRLKKYKYVFLGDGPLMEEMTKYIADNGMSDYISMEGFKTNVSEYMSNSRILVMPSLNEGNPMVINEAFCSGTYVIGNDVGGIHDLLVDNSHGILIDINKYEDFIDKMVNLNETLLKTNKTEDLDLSIYSMDVCVDKYLSLFKVID